ncbi:hypothetical protein GQ457_03G015480 [Hibiscus cannabinus]
MTLMLEMNGCVMKYSDAEEKNVVVFIMKDKVGCKSKTILGPEAVMVIVTELLLDRTLRKYFLSMRPRCLAMHVAIGFALDIACPMQFLYSNGIFQIRRLNGSRNSSGEEGVERNQREKDASDFGVLRQRNEPVGGGGDARNSPLSSIT